MHKKPATQSPRRLLWLLPLALLLCGCERETAEAPAAVAESPAPPAAADSGGGQEAGSKTDTSFSDLSLEEGQYILEVSAGNIGLHANWASRLAILDDLARRGDFALEYEDDFDVMVQVNRRLTGVPELLAVLLDDVAYAAEYRAEAGSDGVRLARVTIGTGGGQARQAAESLAPEPVPELAAVFPEPAADIYLGADPALADLAARLQFGTVIEQIEAVQELDLDPAGLNAAYQLYTQTPSPQVRIAVLEAIEAEDSYLARSMIVMSLQSYDPAEAIYALSIVDALNDYSLARQVEAMQYHPDAEVRELAVEVLESITADFADRGDGFTTPGFSGSAPGGRIERGIDGER